MLFRNYNWPRDLAVKLDAIYRKVRLDPRDNPVATRNSNARLDAALAAVCYDVA